jgi:Restriction endonuclease/Polymer-forming cytoskeletal
VTAAPTSFVPNVWAETVAEVVAEATSPAPADWSLDLLRRLDWKRFQDVASAMIQRGGYVTEAERVKADGARLVSVHRGRKRELRAEALVYLPGWNAMQVGKDVMKQLIDALRVESIQQGVLITPGIISDEAAALAAEIGCELIDGPTFLATLRDMPPADQAWLLQVTTEGEFSHPTCPQCGAKMTQRTSESPPHDGPLEDIGYAHNETIWREVRCGMMVVGREAEVQFMKPVHTRDLVIEGRATGHFFCDGKLTIRHDAVLNGLVAARSIDVAPGGSLDGEASIVTHGPLRPVKPLPDTLVWGCPRYPDCHAVLDVRAVAE